MTGGQSVPVFCLGVGFSPTAAPGGLCGALGDPGEAEGE